MSLKLYRSLNRFITLFNYFFPPLNSSTTLYTIIHKYILFYLVYLVEPVLEPVWSFNPIFGSVLRQILEPILTGYITAINLESTLPLTNRLNGSLVTRARL